jgi:pilus assembly protein CpaC
MGKRILVTALAAMLCIAATPNIAIAQAQPITVQPGNAATIQSVIAVGKSTTISVPVPYTDVLVAEPKIADVTPVDTHTVSIVGKSMGSTVITLYGANKRLLATVNVVVSADIEGLKAQIHQILPAETGVAISAANQSIVLSGTVTSPAALQQVVALAETYNPTKVVNLLSVQGTQQVMLSARFVEMDRTAAKNLGLNISQTTTTGQPQVTVTTGDALINAATTATNTFGAFSLLFRSGGGDLTFLFDALESKGLVKTLAEPTLVALSGDTASFLAGGEFPIPIAGTTAVGTGGVATITIQFKDFGVSLAFTPTILADGLVNMVINPEVSSIDPTLSVSTGGITIPGIKVRRAHTTVELRDGESFTIAGLLEDDYQDNIRQFPWLGDLPVLGTLFRSTSYQHNETELVMVVTPHLVTPRKATVATPADQFVPPSDFELFLLGEERHGELVSPEDRALLTVDPSKGGLDGAYGHVLY